MFCTRRALSTKFLAIIASHQLPAGPSYLSSVILCSLRAHPAQFIVLLSTPRHRTFHLSFTQHERCRSSEPLSPHSTQSMRRPGATMLLFLTNLSTACFVFTSVCVFVAGSFLADPFRVRRFPPSHPRAARLSALLTPTAQLPQLPNIHAAAATAANATAAAEATAAEKPEHCDTTTAYAVIAQPLSALPVL